MENRLMSSESQEQPDKEGNKKAGQPNAAFTRLNTVEQRGTIELSLVASEFLEKEGEPEAKRGTEKHRVHSTEDG